MISNGVQSALSHLPRYVPDDLDGRNLRDLLEDLITAVRKVAEDQQSIELSIRQGWDNLDIQGYVDEAISETAMASEVSDLRIDLQQIDVELREIVKHVHELRFINQGPAGPQGVAGPTGFTGAPGPSGVASVEFKGFIERMKDMEDRMAEIASAVDELEGK